MENVLTSVDPTVAITGPIVTAWALSDTVPRTLTLQECVFELLDIPLVMNNV
jgi:hypothetical protein